MSPADALQFFTAAPLLAQADLASGQWNAWTLILAAGWVVRLVVIVLVLASVWTWAIILAKLARLKRLNYKSSAFEKTFWSGTELEELFEQTKDKPDSPFAALFISAMREWKRAPSLRRESRVLERIERVTALTINREIDRLERQLGVLASVGSSAPFVGLFGTVWGIMTAFINIADSANTSLVVVAPGIAEALVATALGLFAAVPATLGYNKISSDIQRFANRMDDFVTEITTILSRNLEGEGDLR
ncbi:MAG: protein TolQ [Alphaproteobacteria bacterium]|nr:protein TolQ [Alphaproteobacteria bacterium]MDA7983299.1 protein TolQ [Alphaproteobacteria bacterium]MDA7984741.1 protein TolQ [Alphaproteobacteria bacterium]MDA7988030.1 protein TolQ [Alphaproteobacteria bacterium]MDA7989391.1 protein TolQ [Alphaproteobacteria bacterium]